MTFILTASADSTGKRNPNEDAYLCDTTKGIFAVFDGVGRAADGGKASETAAQTFKAAAAELGSFERDDRLVTPWLRETMLDANQAVCHLNSSTTASVMVVCADETEPNVLILNVGDSRVYGFKKSTQRLYQLTTDDSDFSDPRLDDVESTSQISDSMSVAFEFRNVINRALGIDDLGQLEPSIYPLENFDGFLLTTDGVHDNLSTREILNTLLDPANTPENMASQLVREAHQRSQDLDHVRHKKDDITAIYVAVQPA